MGNPWAVQGILDAAVAGLDDIGGNRSDKGVERLRADRVHHALAHLLRIETRRGEALGQYRFVVGADLRPAHVVGAVAGAARDIRVDRPRAQHRDTDIGAFQFVLQGFGQREGGVFAHRIRPLVGTAAVLEAGNRGGVDDMPAFTVPQDGGDEVADAVDDPPDVYADD